jgi:hypothetical protein
MNIICPVCNAHRQDYILLNAEFDGVITGVQVTGLGRGAGFSVTSRFIVDDPQILSQIINRCRRILTCLDRDYLSPKETRDLRASCQQWENYAHQLESNLEDIDDDDEDAEHEMQQLLRKINYEVSFRFDNLEEAIDYLLEL